jgi:hypothetical protein
MALSHILDLIASNGGLDIANPQQLSYLTAQINQDAKELYDQNDLVGSLREQVYNVNVPQGNLISLEPYVGTVRAVRYFFPALNLRIKSSAPHYVARFWQVKDFLAWQIKGDRATYRDITNEGILTFTFKAPLTTALNISIIGASGFASQIIESIACPVGTTVVSSVNTYSEISSLAKDAPCNADCSVTDIDGNELSVIANHQYKSLYQWCQIIDLPNNQNGTSQVYVPACNYVEVLWKLRWKPMVNPQDEFICPNYDEAIFWKFMEHKALLDSTQSIFTANQAQKFKDKADKIIKDVAQNSSQSMEMSLNFGENPTLEAFAYITHNRTGHGYWSDVNYQGYGGLVWP